VIDIFDATFVVIVTVAVLLKKVSRHASVIISSDKFYHW